MKKLTLALLASTVIFAQDLSNVKLLDGINQVQRSIELAKINEADKKDPYHFEKARANRDIANIFASYMDEAGSRLFMVKSFGAVSKAQAGKYKLDDIGLTQSINNSHLDMGFIKSNLDYLRQNRALYCAPVELARAEVYYDALLYELSKENPNFALLEDFNHRTMKELNVATEKVDMAKQGNLECYTGKPFVPQIAMLEEERITQAEKPIESKPQREPLTVTARVHFDFNKHTIKKEYIPLLNEVVKTLKENPDMRIRIEGFTDDIGSKTYNDKLALKRAKAVKDYLVKSGISEDRIEVAGFGKERYIADNRTAIGRFTNRRADFIVIQVPGE